MRSFVFRYPKAVIVCCPRCRMGREFRPGEVVDFARFAYLCRPRSVIMPMCPACGATFQIPAFQEAMVYSKPWTWQARYQYRIRKRRLVVVDRFR